MDITPYIAPGIAVLSLALTQAVKQAVPEEAKPYLPIVAGLIGVAASVVTSLGGITTANAVEVITTGLVSGLAGCGAFEAIKQVTR